MERKQYPQNGWEPVTTSSLLAFAFVLWHSHWDCGFYMQERVIHYRHWTENYIWTTGNPNKVWPNMVYGSNTSLIMSTVGMLILQHESSSQPTWHFKDPHKFKSCMHATPSGVCGYVYICRTEASRRLHWLIGKEGPPSLYTTPTPPSVPVLLLLWWVSVY